MLPLWRTKRIDLRDVRIEIVWNTMYSVLPYCRAVCHAVQSCVI